ncbi:flagellar biosynthesis protein FlhB [Gallaecimonas xiamenensis]|uniref:Flagellar biosynthetic protein FlhB n=1 Tax=Gallaecimonas xiamenensis 3-C-1 TaxID=745411 RepID=K2K9H0_9GAMM|nr:flagellar biosynthesis protein FlhB [Gallaecimonas xiamenensis]EKE73960.1 flagellar biosynthetic protein [Gallaecimonas xiamenensis 3-C-1]
MSDNSAQDKTEKPSAQRLDKARKEGQIARSRELQSAALVLLGGVLILSMSESFGGFATAIMHLQLELDHADSNEPGQMLRHLGDAATLALNAFLPLLVILWLVSFISGMIPGGWLLALKGASPQFKRLNPLSGIKRIFSSQSLVELLKSILKVSMLLSVMAWVLWSHWLELLEMNRQPLGVGLATGLRLVALAVIWLGLVLLFIAVLDVPFQRWSMLKKLRMTKQEVKDEHKNSEGSPEIKSRIRQLQMQVSRQRIDRRVPEADVIVTNPTHYAVAIKYDASAAEAPYVIAKGTDALALRIREVAAQHNKTVLELPELTRAIYHSTRVDQEVPAGLYNAVAHVLMYVIQLNAFKAKGGRRPAPLPQFKIPASLRR